MKQKRPLNSRKHIQGLTCPSTDNGYSEGSFCFFLRTNSVIVGDQRRGSLRHVCLSDLIHNVYIYKGPGADLSDFTKRDGRKKKMKT